MKRPVPMSAERAQVILSATDANPQTVRFKKNIRLRDKGLALAAGKHNTTIYFKRGTKVRGHGAVHLITIGYTGVIGNVSATGVVSDAGTTNVTAPAVGNTTITIASGTSVSAGKYYWLFSGKKEQHETSTTLWRLCGGDPVKITGFDTGSGGAGSVCILDQALKNTYGSGGAYTLLDVDANVTQNIQVMNYDGQGAGGISTSCIFFGLIDNLRVYKLSARNSAYHGFFLGYCRNAILNDVRLLNIGQDNVAGQGYCCQVERSIDVTVNNLYSYCGRYGLGISTGAANVTINGMYTENQAECVFDSHGGDNYNVTFNNVAGNSDVRLGNQSWRGGAQNWTLNGINAKALNLTGAIRDLAVNNSNFTELWISADKGDSNTDSNYSAQPTAARLVMTDCNFIAVTDKCFSIYSAAGVNYHGIGGSISGGIYPNRFVRCTFAAVYNSYWSAVSFICPKGIAEMNVHFDQCIFTPDYNRAGNGYSAIKISTDNVVSAPNQKIKLTGNTATLHSQMRFLIGASNAAARDTIEFGAGNLRRTTPGGSTSAVANDSANFSNVAVTAV